MELEYTLRKRRGQKRMTLSVHESGRVTLTVPRWVTQKAAHAFVEERSQWIRTSLQSLVSGVTVDPQEARNQYLKHKEDARELVLKRLSELNQQYNYVYNRVSIRMNSSRWGSCNSKGNLSFDFRILFLPPELQEYLLVHELCHLKEMNHSPRFWALVAHAVPDYKQRQQALHSLQKRELL
jgi:predicted metal-dependent hydrolase